MEARDLFMQFFCSRRALCAAALPILCCVIAGCASDPGATSVPTVTPAAHPAYPPKSQADLLGLAAKGDASALQEFHSESVGLAACPQPKRQVLVTTAHTGQQFAEDLLAYFYSQHLDNPCGAVVFAYRSQSETGSGGYTAGRILLDVLDASGAPNGDPAASGLTYKVTLDVGDFATGQEFVVSY